MPQFTKMAIIKSFYNLLSRKNFEKITVKDIVEECGVNRKTFYYYFTDIYDLVEQIFRLEIEAFSVEISKSASVEDKIIGVFELAEKNKKAVMHLHLSSDGELEKYLKKIMLDLLSDGVKHFAKEKEVSEDDATLVCGSMVLIFMGFFRHWVEEGMQSEYREVIRKICRMLNGTMELMLENLKNTDKN